MRVEDVRGNLVEAQGVLDRPNRIALYKALGVGLGLSGVSLSLALTFGWQRIRRLHGAALAGAFGVETVAALAWPHRISMEKKEEAQRQIAAALASLIVDDEVDEGVLGPLVEQFGGEVERMTWNDLNGIGTEWTYEKLVAVLARLPLKWIDLEEAPGDLKREIRQALLQRLSEGAVPDPRLCASVRELSYRTDFLQIKEEWDADELWNALQHFHHLTRLSLRHQIERHRVGHRAKDAQWEATNARVRALWNFQLVEKVLEIPSLEQLWLPATYRTQVLQTCMLAELGEGRIPPEESFLIERFLVTLPDLYAADFDALELNDANALAMIRRTPQLRHLDLRHNSLQFNKPLLDGISELAHLEALRLPDALLRGTVQSFHLASSFIGFDPAQLERQRAIGTIVRELNTRQLLQCSQQWEPNQVIAVLEALPHLQVLDLNDSKLANLIDDRMIEVIAQMSDLHTLCLPPGRRVSAGALRKLAGLRQLHHLELNFDDEGCYTALNFLGDLPRLVQLQLGAGLSDKTLALLPTDCSSYSLVLRSPKVTASGIAMLVKRAPRHLAFRGVPAPAWASDERSFAQLREGYRVERAYLNAVSFHDDVDDAQMWDAITAQRSYIFRDFSIGAEGPVLELIRRRG